MTKNKQRFEEKLKEITEKLKKIPEIIGIFYTGSTATKTWTKYSDLDINILVEDKDYNKIVKKLPKILSGFGNMKLCNHYKGIDETYAFFDEDYFKVDLHPIKESEVHSYKDEKKRIVFDKKRIITDESKKQTKNIKADEKEFKHLLLDTRSNFIYIARHYAKWQKLSATSEFGGIGGDLFHLLAQLKGFQDYELFRNAEKILTKEEWNIIKNAKCDGLSKLEVKSAIRRYLAYMKYIERLYEKRTGKKLALKCNDKEILGIINKTLDEAR